jgi:hypothetical protein
MLHDLTHNMVSGPQPMLALPDLDTIVFLVVVAVSLLGRLFGKKDPEHAEEWIDAEKWDEGGKEQGRQSNRPQALDWEQEMRRLLEGRAPQPTRKTAPEPPPLESPPPVPYLDDQVVVIPRVPTVESLPPASQASRLKQAEEAYRKAQALKTQAAARMAEMGQLPATESRRTRRSSAAQSVIDMLRRSGSARQAIIASEILGPAKGLQ